jgi:hypothetical protein
MTFWYITRMDEQRSWSRRARRSLSVCLLTCRISNSDQEVMHGPRFNHNCYSNRGYSAMGRTHIGQVPIEPIFAEPFCPFFPSP